MKRDSWLNIVVRDGISILKLFASKYKSLLLRRYALLLLYLSLQVLYSIARAYFLKCYSFASECFHLELHLAIYLDYVKPNLQWLRWVHDSLIGNHGSGGIENLILYWCLLSLFGVFEAFNLIRFSYFTDSKTFFWEWFKVNDRVVFGSDLLGIRVRHSELEEVGWSASRQKVGKNEFLSIS